MTIKKLPSRLNKEPLIDVVCEIRFSSTMAVSDVLPGLLMAKSSPAVSGVERLPISEIPAQIRDADSNLKYQPVLRINWGDFFVLVGNRTLAIACKLPYPGWSKMKDAMMDLVRHGAEMGLFKKIERYSMKYVDLIEGSDLRDLIGRANLNLKVGGHQLVSENFSVRLEISESSILHIVQISAPATAVLLGGVRKSGMITDIDSVCAHETTDVKDFVASLPNHLDEMHEANKRIFFSCLTDKAIDHLEPIYEHIQH